MKEEFDEVEVDLIRGGRGDFVVKVDGDVVWNKKVSGSFPDERALVRSLRDRA